MAYVFGVFRLGTRKLVYVALIAIMCYALMVRLLLHFRPQEVDLRLEILHLVVFGPTLLWFAVMGGYISQLRKELSDSKVVIEEMATRDALTGAYNRRHLLSMLLHLKSRSDRSKEVFCVGILDLDFFKAINDTFGHQVGDEVLKACARCGIEAVRSIDCFGRYGGEEFEVLLAQTELEGARIAAERIRSSIEKLRFPHIDPKLHVTASIGLARYYPKEKVEETEKRADAALYRAKVAGRNRIEVESTSGS
jgi:diguanylate cyclase (GGDEF)-like protein